MHLTPREQERRTLFTAAELGRRRLALRARLGSSDAIAVVCDGMGGAARKLASVFVSEQCLEDSAPRAALPSGVRYSAVRRSRCLGRGEMVVNTATLRVEVPRGPDPLLVDGVPVDRHDARSLPRARVRNRG